MVVISFETMSILEIQNPTIRSFVYGSLSGTCSTLLFQPLDLVKTRMQRHSFLTTNLHGKSKKLGMMQVLIDVVRKEQLFSLWRGTIPVSSICIEIDSNFHLYLSFKL